MPLDNRYLHPLTNVVGDIEDKEAANREDPCNLCP